MDEIIARAECYIKGEESNAEKKARNSKERSASNPERKSYYPTTVGDRPAFKRQERRAHVPYDAITNFENFTPLNTRPERILKEVYNTRLILAALTPKGFTMGPDSDSWCKYHRIEGHHTDTCVHLRREIEKLLQNGKLRGYAKEARGEDKRERNRRAKKTKSRRTSILSTPYQEGSQGAGSLAHLGKNLCAK